MIDLTDEQIAWFAVAFFFCVLFLVLIETGRDAAEPLLPQHSARERPSVSIPNQPTYHITSHAGSLRQPRYQPLPPKPLATRPPPTRLPPQSQSREQQQQQCLRRAEDLVKQLNNERHRKYQAQLVKKTVLLPTPQPQPQPQRQPQPQPHVIPSYGTVQPSLPALKPLPPKVKPPQKKPSQKPKQHVRRQSEEAEDPHYTRLRERAWHEGNEATRCSQESRKAYAFRDKVRAKKLSEEKKAHEAERDRLNAEASAWIYNGT